MSSITLARAESNIPASYIAASVGRLRDRVVRRAVGWLFSLGARHLQSSIVEAYETVATPRDAARAAEQLLTHWSVRQWIVNFEMVRRARVGRDVPEHHPWIPEDLSPRLRVLSRCVDAFNRWALAKPGALPPSLSLLLEDSFTPNFHRAFDDGRLPASVRLAYYSHHMVGLHAVALLQAHDGALPSMVVPSVVDALRTDVRRALGLALGIPGVEGVREQLHVDLDDVEILDLDAEQEAWDQYLRDARPVE